MAGMVPVLILLDEASINTFLDLVFDPVDSVSWGGVWAPSYHRPLKLGFEFEVHLDQLFARQGRGQRFKNLMVVLDELTQTRVKVHALQFLRKFLLSMEVALPLFLLLHTPHSFKGQLILSVLATLLDIVKGVYKGYIRIGERHFFIIVLGPYRRFAGLLEEVDAGQSLDTLSLGP